MERYAPQKTPYWGSDIQKINKLYSKKLFMPTSKQEIFPFVNCIQGSFKIPECYSRYPYHVASITLLMFIVLETTIPDKIVERKLRNPIK